jgi:hypothetical protein
LNPERFLHTGRTGFAQCGNGVLVGDIAGNKNNARGKIGPVDAQPGVYTRTVYAAWSSHI